MSFQIKRMTAIIVGISLGLSLLLLWYLSRPVTVYLAVTDTSGAPVSDALIKTMEYDNYLTGKDHEAVTIGHTDEDGRLIWESAARGPYHLRVEDMVVPAAIFPLFSNKMTIPVTYEPDFYTVTVHITDLNGNPVPSFPVYFDAMALESYNSTLLGIDFQEFTDENGDYSWTVPVGGHVIFYGNSQHKEPLIIKPSAKKSYDVEIVLDLDMFKQISWLDSEVN